MTARTDVDRSPRPPIAAGIVPPQGGAAAAPGSAARRNLRRATWAILVLVAAGVGRMVYDEWTAPDDPSRHRSLPPVVVAPARADAPYVRIIALGDTGTGGRGQRAVAAGVARRCEAEPADLLLLLGDNFYPNGVRSTDDPQWEEKIVEPYGDLGMPIYAVLGNHDHNGDWSAQVERSRVDPRWRMPAPWYRASLPAPDGALVELFVLDTELFFDEDYPARAEEQLAWLDGALAASRARWKAVAGHHPVHSNSGHGTHTMQRILEPVLIRRHVDLYLAGHDHCLQVLGPRDGVTYVVSGGGSGDDSPDEVRWEDDTSFAATRGGFVALRAGAEDLVIEVARTDGEVVFAKTIGQD